MASTENAITPSDYSSLFNIVTWVLEALVLLLVTLKLLLAHSSFGLHSDDWGICVATVASIGQVCAVSLQSFGGLGRPQVSLSPADVERFQKSAYAAEFLYIISLGASKLSIIFLITFVTRNPSRRMVAHSIAIFIGLWSLSSIFVTAFQCSSPRAWSMLYGKCIQKIPFWTSFAAINILTEFFLLILPAEMIYRTTIDRYRKSVLIFCFALRFAVIAAIAAQIYCMYSPQRYVYMATRTDFTFYSWPYMLTTEVVQALSITTVCIPFLKPLLVGLQTGMLQIGRVRFNSASNASPGGNRKESASGRGAPRSLFVVGDDAKPTGGGVMSRQIGGLGVLNVRDSRAEGGKKGSGRRDVDEIVKLERETDAVPLPMPLSSSSVGITDQDQYRIGLVMPAAVKSERSSMSSGRMMREWGFGRWFER